MRPWSIQSGSIRWWHQSGVRKSSQEEEWSQ
jgi:hypothetical protein